MCSSDLTDQRTFSITIKAPVTANYNYTGSDQTLTLPAGVNTFVVHAWGGGGAGFPGAPFVGGAGGYTTAAVTNTEEFTGEIGTATAKTLTTS